jgi:hypothetical protein
MIFSYLLALPVQEQKGMNSDFLAIDFGYKSAYIQAHQRDPLTIWQFDFVSTSIGITHWHKKNRLMNPFIGVSAFADFMVRGKLISSTAQRPLSDELKSVNLGVALNGGLSYSLADDMSLAVGIGYQRGLQNLEKFQEKQSLMHAGRLSIAMLITLNKNLIKSNK